MPNSFIPLQLFMPFSYLGHVRTILVDIVMEKSEKYHEYLMINGLSRSAYIFSHLVFIYFRCVVLTLVCCSGFIFAGDLPAHTIVHFFVLYFVVAIGVSHFALFFTTLFSNKELCSDIGGFVYSILCFSYVGALMNATDTWYFIATLFPQNAIAFDIILMSKEYDIMLTETQIWVRLVIMIVVYFLLYLYLEQVFPNEYGVAKPWNFCCEKRADKKKHHENRNNDGDEERLIEDEDQSSALHHETFNNPEKLQRSINIQDISKKFGHIKAVDNVSMMIYENQVTCLLGHNGAGKTTTINLLTGVLDHDRGDILYYKTPFGDYMEKSRHTLGLCCQENIRYIDLTTRENLELIGKIRGLSGSKLDQEVESILKQVQLEKEANKYAGNLSGGNQRKLAIAMAIIGNSKIIFLDEPTSGLDPNTRRSIWDIVKRLKQEGRTVLLTTHHLDEADELADRLAIMSHGKLFALGTSEFIKKRFGAGYHLIITPDYENPQKAELATIELKIDEIVKRHISSGKQICKNAETIQYQLPFNEQPQFSKLFEELEKIQGIRINLQMNSLEDAFINIGVQEGQQTPPVEERIIQVNNNQSNNQVEDTKKSSYNFKSQFKAMYWRKYHSTLRDTTTKVMILLPAFFVFVGISISSQDAGSHVLTDYSNAYTFLFFVNFAYCLNSTVYAAFPVYERETRIRYTMKNMGLKDYVYWVGNLGFDLVTLSFINLVLIFFVYVFGFHLLQTRPIMLLIGLYAYGLCLISSSYMYGFYFERSSTVYKGYAAFYFFVLLILPQLIFAIFKSMDLAPWILKVLKLMCYHVSPMITFQDTMVYLIVGPQAQYVDPSLYFTSFPACIFFMLYLTILYLGITYYMESKELSVKVKNANNAAPDDDVILPEEVKNELERVSGTNNKDPVRVIHLKKTYPNKFTAVKDLSFGVNEGEIFGMLGPNGAGKSTTFGILTALFPRTKGNVMLKGESIDYDMSNVFIDVGVCPQYDSLWEHLTVEEHLRVYGRIKGFKKAELTTLVNRTLQDLRIQDASNEPAGTLSGGTKRKLCTAIALTGNPSIIFLDEPSTGLDPMAKRQLWAALNRAAVQQKASIILTTHSMEEAEYLCGKIGIIVNGRFVCFGPLNYLKNTYGAGYKLSLVKKNSEIDAKTRILKIFNDAILQESKDCREMYQISMTSFVFSKAFRELQDLKAEGLIEDFSIYNTTLEQVFIHFSKEQVVQNSRESQGPATNS